MSEWPSTLVPMPAQIFALQVAIGGIVVSGVVLLAARALRRRSAPLRYGVLFAGVVGLLAVPAFVGVGQRLQATIFEAPTVEIGRIPAERPPELLALDAPDEPLPEAAAPWSEAVGPILLCVWLLGCLIGFVRLARGLWIQRRALVGSPWQTAWWTQERQAQLAQALGLRSFPAVFSSPAAPMPLVLGLFRPMIVLPEHAPTSWGQAQLEAVLLHEAAHIARRDPWAVLLQQLGVILFWWCPLVHVLARRLSHLREQICDDFALQGACDGIAYAEILIESAERLVRLQAVPVPVGLLDSARGGLEDRITRLLQKEREPMTKLTWPGKLLGAACLVSAGLLITAATAFSGGGATPAAPKKVQIKIIVDGKEIELNDVQIQGILDAAPRRAPQPEKAPNVIAPVPPIPVKPDPRIEELVRAAEAIKPGSGEEVRRALLGKAGDKTIIHLRGGGGPGMGPIPVPGGAAPEKKIIILSIENGKVIQLQGHELKILMDRGVMQDLKLPPGHPPIPMAVPPTPADPFKRAPGAPSGADPARPLAPPAADKTDVLLRQIERINRELQELRQQLNDNKRGQGR